MNITQLQSDIQQLGYGSEFKKDTSTRLIIYMEASERVSALKDIATTFGGRYTPSKTGVGWRSSVGAALLPDNMVVLAKPKTTGTTGNIASLDARDFYRLATPGTFNFQGQDIGVVTFTKADVIQKSIVQGVHDQKLLGPSYSEAFQDFFDTGKINWNPGTPRPIINKLGVYVGEVMIGWVFLKNSRSLYTKHFSNNPFSGTAVAFHMPTDPAFSGVDSFVEMKDGSFYPISSKFGAGAKASFFTNLFEKGIKSRDSLESSYFKNMCILASRKNISFKKSKEFVYEFGIRELLGISEQDIRTPTSVFDNIRRGTPDDDVEKVMKVIKDKTTNQQILSGLPDSISAYFNRTIAENLNNDPKSVKQMTEILAGKDYWQANLDINKWINGSMKFRFINSGEANINLIGSKSAITDITSKQGWINYELKYS